MLGLVGVKKLGIFRGSRELEEAGRYQGGDSRYINTRWTAEAATRARQGKDTSKALLHTDMYIDVDRSQT
jgi:hypothetical protein